LRSSIPCFATVGDRKDIWPNDNELGRCDVVRLVGANYCSAGDLAAIVGRGGVVTFATGERA